MKKALFFLLTAWLVCSAQRLEDLAPMAPLLNSVGLSVEDLGYSPRGDWTGFPHPESSPFLLRSFTPLYAHPLDAYPFLKNLTDRTSRLLSSPGRETYYRVLYFLGVDTVYVGFRGYNAELADWWYRRDRAEWEEPAEEGPPLTPETVVNLLKDRSGEEDWDAEPLLEFLKTLDEDGLRFYGFLLVNFADIWKLASSAGAECNFDPDDPHSWRDADDKVRWSEMWWASLKLAELSGYLIEARGKLKVSPPRKTVCVPLFSSTACFGAKGKDSYENAVLVVDWGGSDVYSSVPRSDPSHPASLVVDFGGNDVYRGEVGSGVLGVSLIVDLHGDDSYEGEERSIGFGNFGFGGVYDLEGNDSYSVRSEGVGCGERGIGLLVDLRGNDTYRAVEEGIGFGGFGGFGGVVDWEGDDRYISEPWAEKAGVEGDYHSGGKVLANCTMGAGWGRRADFSDGESWAGGFGLLADFHGDDSYSAGNWAIGVGYWLGMGMLYDGEGNDSYSSCYFSQGSSAHFAMGFVLDEDGDDRMVLWGDEKTGGYGWAGAGLGFGWDFSVGMVVNVGGNDYYEAKKIALGCGEVRSLGLFLDVGGDDTYKFRRGGLGLGGADARDYSRPYYCYEENLGIFLDYGGSDRYVETDSEGGEKESEVWKDGGIWFSPHKSHSFIKEVSRGVGADVNEEDN